MQRNEAEAKHEHDKYIRQRPDTTGEATEKAEGRTAQKKKKTKNRAEEKEAPGIS